jgi:hypothetical protein|tara:strand:- start:104 stop:250 length:147 start_codon:yes stop_codon:yes gene_type:complete
MLPAALMYVLVAFALGFMIADANAALVVAANAANANERGAAPEEAPPD